MKRIILYTVAVVSTFIILQCGTDGPWKLLQEEAAFSPRDTAAGFSFLGKYWLSNGYYHGNVLTRDLWYSTNAVDWDLANDATPYDGYSSIAVLNNAAYAVQSSVWTSLDGIHWNEILHRTPFAPGLGRVTVLGDHLVYVTAGEVWTSADGKDWARTATPMFGNREHSSLITLGDRLIYLAGGYLKEDGSYESQQDVWASQDAIEWLCLSEKPGWTPRLWPALATFKGHLYLFGGYDNNHKQNLGDFWTTEDGITWEEIKSPEAPSPRHFSTMYTADEGIILVAGNAWPVKNDVWLYQPASSNGKGSNTWKQITGHPRSHL